MGAAIFICSDAINNFVDSSWQGAVEVDESYFGPRRVRGKRGRGAYGKTMVFGLLKRDGRVYTGMVPDCTKTTLQGVIRGHIAPDTVIHSDGWRYNGLVDIGFDKHFRVNHGVNEFARVSITSMPLNRSGVMPNASYKSLTAYPPFCLHLKETEFRFHHRCDNLYLEMLNLLRMNPL